MNSLVKLHIIQRYFCKYSIAILLFVVVFAGCQDQARHPDQFIPIYDMDTATNKTIVGFYVFVPDNWSIEKKLKHLANKLSHYQFGHIPIEIQNIEHRREGTIAIINLRESEWNSKLRVQFLELWDEGKGKEADSLLRRMHGPTWFVGYFQGSTGGMRTTITLRDTFLQPGYRGDWIDGIVFLYENEPMNKWDHVFLGGVILRTQEQQ